MTTHKDGDSTIWFTPSEQPRGSYKTQEFRCPDNNCTITMTDFSKSKSFCEMGTNGRINRFDIERCVEMAGEFNAGKKTADTAVAFTITQIIAVIERECSKRGIDINPVVTNLKWS